MRCYVASGIIVVALSTVLLSSAPSFAVNVLMRQVATRLFLDPSVGVTVCRYPACRWCAPPRKKTNEPRT